MVNLMVGEENAFLSRSSVSENSSNALFKFIMYKEIVIVPINIHAMHITASVFVNDDEAGLHADFLEWLEKLAPHEPVSGYRHNRGEDNADSHMKRQLFGRECVVAVTEGRLHFGPWERIFYGEFDGRRRKRVLVKIIGE